MLMYLTESNNILMPPRIRIYLVRTYLLPQRKLLLQKPTILHVAMVNMYTVFLKNIGLTTAGWHLCYTIPIRQFPAKTRQKRSGNMISMTNLPTGLTKTAQSIFRTPAQDLLDSQPAPVEYVGFFESPKWF
jgi:hypothetical protein